MSKNFAGSGVVESIRVHCGHHGETHTCERRGGDREEGAGHAQALLCEED